MIIFPTARNRRRQENPSLRRSGTRPTNAFCGIESKTLRKPASSIQFLPLPGGLEPLGKRRKESAEGGGPERAERAGASESLGRGEGERKHTTIRWQAQIRSPKKSLRTRALTLLEILIVIAMIGALAALLLPALVKMKRHDQRVQCVNNTKQIGLSFRVAALNGGTYPLALPEARGGSADFTTGLNAWHHFQILSNELSTPKILVCPADNSRSVAPDFASLRNANLSYFVGVNATNEDMADMILSGDRNLTNGTPVKNGILAVSTNTPAGWTSSMHVRVGNIVCADGSVQQVSNNGLRSAIQYATNAPTLLQMPELTP